MAVVDLKVVVTVPRYTTELVNIVDLLVNRIAEIQENVPGEFDLYINDDDPSSSVMCRIETWHNLSKADMDLFDSDSRMFWELHIGKVTGSMIEEINTIHYVGWRI